MENDQAKSLTETPTRAVQRRQQLVEMTIDSLGIGRQNLRDSQFSPDSKLVEYFEGIALGFDGLKSAQSRAIDRIRRFRSASELIEQAKLCQDKADLPAQKVVGLEARCNLATVLQQGALKDWHKRDWTLPEGKLKDLNEALVHYRSIKNDFADVPEEDKERIETTAKLGELVCLVAFYRAKMSYDNNKKSPEELESEARESHADLTEKVVRLISSASSLKAANARSSSSLQILRQVQGSLKAMEAYLPGVIRPAKGSGDASRAIENP